MSGLGLSSIFGSTFDEEILEKGTPSLPRPRRRLAFVDLNFSWPPNGGADIDLYNVMLGLQDAGQEVHLFVLHENGSLERGAVDAGRLPFPATRLDFAPKALLASHVASTFREHVDAWRPDIVFLMHGFALKAHVALALAHHRCVGRYYAHEAACARDPLRFRNGAPCTKDFFRTPQDCRRCALHALRPAICSGAMRTWARDYAAAAAYAPGYYDIALRAIQTMRAVIVSNTKMKAHFAGIHDNVYVFPGGVHAKGMAFSPARNKMDGESKIILMPGRVEDPLKGLQVLRAAGELLARQRSDFEIWATHFDLSLSTGWFRAVGWRDHAGAIALYKEADIVVAPSLWEEPFGLVAVEGMAAGRPVCASRTGGLQDIVAHGENGFLHTPGNAEELAQHLALLLDQPQLRTRMGAAGRLAVEAQYDWDRIIRSRYLPLIDRLMA